MKVAAILLSLLALYTVAAGAGCGRAGALRCDADGRHLSACTSHGEWLRVRDCAVTHAACVDGRCVPQLRTNATRAGECTPYSSGCADCVTKRYCSANGVWVSVGQCKDNTVCICGDCKSSEDYSCGNPVVCSPSAVGHSFPSLENCNDFFDCQEDWEEPSSSSCGNRIYDPCKETCVASQGECVNNNTPCNSTNNGQYFAVGSNPSQYYFCVNDTAVWHRCEDGFFNLATGACFPATVCKITGSDRSGNRDTGGGTDHTKKRHLSYDNCSTTGTNSPLCAPGDTWSYPNDECRYYFCISSTDVKVVPCPPNSKFDENAAKCVISEGSCTST